VDFLSSVREFCHNRCMQVKSSARAASRNAKRVTRDRSMFARMLDVVRRIPYGKVATYGDVAYVAGFPGSARQVAWALHKSSGLPWHRVVGAAGRIMLPGEAGFEQRMRLHMEGVEFAGLRVRMDVHRHTWFRRAAAKGHGRSGR
jgi:methylated-DNA-protein-cysteine methyltransferase-like protein